MTDTTTKIESAEAALAYSNQVRELEKRHKNGEEYHVLQGELEQITQKFIEDNFRYRIGDIITLQDPKQEPNPIDYSLDYCFNNCQYDIVIDYYYDGYDKGLNRVELLDIIENSKHFHHILDGNYLFRSLYGWTKDWKEKRAEHDSESYITLDYDLYQDSIAYYQRKVAVVDDQPDLNYSHVKHIAFDITKKTDTQDLYFLRDESGAIKIGISNDVIKRVFDLSSAMGQRIDILRVINNGGKLERTLHKKFGHLRQNRQEQVDGYTEWFHPKNELLDFIDNFSFDETEK